MADDVFDEAYFAQLDSASGHWWEQGMAEVAKAILDEDSPPLDVLDAGCGAGTNLTWLDELAGAGRLVGVDTASISLSYARRAGTHAELTQASVVTLPYADAAFDLVVSMDVLQHLTVDEAKTALVEVRRVLRSGGRLLVRTNAVFGRRHVRQRPDWRLYTPTRLGQSLAAAGLVVERLTPVNALQGAWASLPRPRLRKPMPSHGGTHGSRSESTRGLGLPQPVSRRRNATALALLRIEARWLARPGRSIPFGHSLYAVARRPPTPLSQNGRSSGGSVEDPEPA